jgi:hypothetical protein
MRYVIIRDDDTNALTPVDCLERLYRPFLEQGLPVNLATIPAVATEACRSDGSPEGFLVYKNGVRESTVPLAVNSSLVQYLRGNPGFHILQHGLHHEYLEFDRSESAEISRRLEEGTRFLLEAGIPRPKTFVAPYDRLSKASLTEVAKRFEVLSTGWYELRRLPVGWWPEYAWKKLRRVPHWRVRDTLLLSHPGCLLSCDRPYSAFLDTVIQHISSNRLTVLVTHWWEYFRHQNPDESFIEFLHQTAHYLAACPELKVISFAELLQGGIPLN